MNQAALKILSYNIHKGFSANNRDFVLKLIKESIKPIGANIVFLQEVIGQHNKDAKRWRNKPTQSQFEYLADQIWSHYAYGKNAVYSSGHHGNALLSEFPIVSWHNKDISSNKLEKRGLLHAVIEIPAKKLDKNSKNSKPLLLHCFCVHLSLFQTGRKKQLRLIIETIKSETKPDEPFILAGDFNDWKNIASDILTKELGATEVFLSKNGKHARTFPAQFPVLCLDRIYVRGLHAKKIKALKGRPWSKLSDHLAVYAELKLI